MGSEVAQATARPRIPAWIAARVLQVFVALSACSIVAPGAGDAIARSGDVPDYKAALATSQAAIGEPVGDFVLTDSSRRQLTLASLRGKPLLVQFVYTGCFQACPVTTQFLSEAVRSARQALGEGAFRVATIGFNQPFDDPAAMADFERRYRLGISDWLYLSPAPTEIARLTANFGFVYKATPKGFDHIAQVSIVDAEGRIYRQVYGERFDLPMLIGPLKELISGQAARQMTVDDIWTRVKLYCTVYDPQTGSYRVDYSLFFELFAGITVLGTLAWVIVRESRRTGG